MQDKVTTVPFTISISFSQGFSQGILDLVSSRTSEFTSIVVGELLHGLATTKPGDNVRGAKGHLVVFPQLSLSDFDDRITVALHEFRRKMHDMREPVEYEIGPDGMPIIFVKP